MDKKFLHAFALLLLSAFVHCGHLKPRTKRQAIPWPTVYQPNFYGEPCSKINAPCHSPYVCNDMEYCDCPEGYNNQYGKCVINCPINFIPINDTCHETRGLGQRCELDEQCTAAYSRCTDGKCQCLKELRQIGDRCESAPRCFFGQPAKGNRGQLVHCNDDANCPTNYWCWFITSRWQDGVCCPQIDIKCPVGDATPLDKPIVFRNSQYYEYTVMAGHNSRSLLCPNPCPTSMPLLIDDKCYKRSGFGEPCENDAQCNDVTYNAICKQDAKGDKRCGCPENGVKFLRGQCVGDSSLGESCSTDIDCQLGSNTYCEGGKCQCYSRFIPEILNDGKKATRCIAEPVCPSGEGMTTMSSFVECTDDASKCKEDEFCRTWWYEAHRNYSTCCKKPGEQEYQALCSQLNMAIEYKNLEKKQPFKCKIEMYPPQTSLFTRSKNPNVCPIGMHCVYDPYESNVHSGICCKVKGLKPKPPVSYGWSAVVVPSNAPIPPVGLDNYDNFL